MLTGDKAMPALHFLAETAVESILEGFNDDSASTCKGGGEAGCASVGRHGEADDEGDQVGLQGNNY